LTRIAVLDVAQNGRIRHPVEVAVSKSVEIFEPRMRVDTCRHRSGCSIRAVSNRHRKRDALACCASRFDPGKEIRRRFTAERDGRVNPTNALDFVPTGRAISDVIDQHLIETRVDVAVSIAL
jgi:hypothetical protein